MTRLTLEQASHIVDAALAAAVTLAAKPLAVVVLDAGGHPLALKRHEEASLYRADIATAKAQGALGMGSGSRTLAERAAASPAFFAALSTVTAGRIVPVRADPRRRRHDPRRDRHQRRYRRHGRALRDRRDYCRGADPRSRRPRRRLNTLSCRPVPVFIAIEGTPR
jgi:uncharacterized protein GlcG (DUF336 family)